MHCTLSTGNDTVAQLPSGLISLIYYKPYDCIWPSIRTLVFFQKAKWRQRAVIRLTNSLVPELTISFCFSIVALMPRFFFSFLLLPAAEKRRRGGDRDSRHSVASLGLFGYGHYPLWEFRSLSNSGAQFLRCMMHASTLISSSRGPAGGPSHEQHPHPIPTPAPRPATSPHNKHHIHMVHDG
jgi:hypothetical protein